MQFSRFASRFSSESGIVQLMEDLGAAMSGQQQVLMLGGGNPAHIPAVLQFLQERMERIVHDPAEFAHIVGNYDPPQGESRFIGALAELLRTECSWDVGPQNIALTAGSQAGFFCLFNMFAGEFADGTRKRILLPMAPEYIGYADVGLSDDLFVSCRPEIEYLDNHLFKYHVDFNHIQINDDIGAMCVSRPTNPTGNVLQDSEVEQLLKLARGKNIPLIIDNAYGLPFPGIIFTAARPLWDRDVIVCMSLSKLGMPGARTGIIIAHEEVIRAITNINAVINLALGSFGPALALDLIHSGEILRISRNVIRPYYQQRMERAVELLHRYLAGVEYHLHKPEGAIFLWLWLPDLPVTSEELYQRLKRKGVLVISGHHFFPGLNENWPHKHQCIRLTYSMPEHVVEAGIRIIADEIKSLQ